MKSRVCGLGRGGFTLIEILVSLILLAVLSSFLVPGIVQQMKASDAPRISNDLTSIRTALTTFTANVPPVYPGDLEDLVYRPFRDPTAPSTTNSDVTVNASVYTAGQVNRWNGEYLETLLTQKDLGNSTGQALLTGFNGAVQYDLICYDAAISGGVGNAATRVAGACATGDYVTVKVLGVKLTDFLKVNDLVDGDNGESSGDKQTKGKLRFRAGDGSSTPDTIFFLAAPYRS